MSRAPRKRVPMAAPGRIRIIAGSLRGSRIDVPDAPGLRPTSDRVRETVFNWLAPSIHGAVCLDLFAGSGALGFEAASRGAAETVLVERDAGLAANLRAVAQRLRIESARVENADALAWLARPPQRRFDIVFIDPPFAAGLLDASLAALEPHLADEAWIYVEHGQDQVASIPSAWGLHRDGTTREVRYALYRRSAAAAATLPADR
jgi:16S rRNA (guanine966-N2)-methyltransferase